MTPEFLQSLILLLIGLLFFKENILSWIGKKLGFSNGDKIPEWAKDLKYHFNHETTAQNNETLGLLREIRDSQRNMCIKIDKTINLLENQDKYGVKARKD